MTKRFKKDYARLNKSGRRNVEKLDEIMKSLIYEEALSSAHRDHALQGKWEDYRECHIEGDWLLVYKLEIDTNGEEAITFIATDNHSNLFR